MGSVLSVQVGAAVATTLFDELGPSGTVLLRTGFAAVILVAIWRPQVPRAASGPLRDAVLLGIALAGMNLSFYAALDRIPLGIAVTLEFTGPFAVAVAASRRASDLRVGGAWRPAGSSSSPPACTARSTAWGSRSRCSRAPSGPPTSCWRRASAGGSAAARAWQWRWRWRRSCCSRSAWPAAAATLARPGLLAVGLAVAVLSSAIPYSLELEALRRLQKGTFGVLMSLEPAVAALVGLVLLGQDLSATEVVAIALVVAASAGALGSARAPAPVEA